MTNDNVAYKGEAQLLRWSDSNSGGPTITLALPSSEDLDRFRGATLKKGGKAGQLYAVMIVEVDYDAQADEAAPPANDNEHGAYYQQLHRMGWFYNPAVWRALGTDEDYRAWIQHQPSCVSGDFSEWVHGEGRCIAAHVRRVAEGAGTGHKPPYSCVPLTDAEHQRQHQLGEGAFGGPEWFDKQRAEYLKRWVKHRLYELLGITSLKQCAPAAFENLIHQLGIGHTLPGGR